MTLEGRPSSTDTATVLNSHPLPPIWLKVLTLLLALAGLGISTYLTITHFVGTQILVCSESGIVNCAKVTTSPQSEFFGVPVAVLGLVFYIAMTLMVTPPAWNSMSRRVHIARAAMIVVGMAFALYLVSAELLIIGNICLWCTGVHVITFVLFVLIVTSLGKVLRSLPNDLGVTPSTLEDGEDGEDGGSPNENLSESKRSTEDANLND